MSRSSTSSSRLRLKHIYRELLLIEGIAQEGLGNWHMIAEHVGTRTKEDVEEHYNSVYVDSPNWPLPVRLYGLAFEYPLNGVHCSGWTSHSI